MTTTNRAFIKAYRHDAAEPTPAGPAMAEATRTAPLRGAAVVRGFPDPAPAPTEGLALDDRRPAVREVTRSGDRPQHPTAKQPLSSFIAMAGSARLDSEPAEADFFRPGTTVASFQWPAVCRALAQQSGLVLDQVAEMLEAQAEAGRSLIGVLGLFDGCGATTTALCLAARMAGRGHRIILVDGNFSKPRLATWLEATPTAGWQEVLDHGAPLADAAIRATDDRLDLLALGTKQREDALRLVSSLQAVVTAGVLRHAYDLVMVDAGVFFDPASQPVVLELVRNMGIDTVLGVAGPQPADPRDLETIAGRLGRSGCELLGVIENRVAKTQAA